MRATNVTQVRHRSHTTEFQFAGQRAQKGKAPATKAVDPWGSTRWKERTCSRDLSFFSTCMLQCASLPSYANI